MADIVTDISVNKNWNARKGANNPVTFTFTQSLAAFNISTYTFSIQLRKFGSDTNLLNLTQGSGITNNGAAGTLSVVITSANLSTFTADDYYWQMTVVHPDTFSYLWFQGTFNLFSETYTGDLTTTVNESIDVNGTTINVAITLGGGAAALTNGNGTTANGSAVDLGGTASNPVVLNLKQNDTGLTITTNNTTAGQTKYIENFYQSPGQSYVSIEILSDASDTNFNRIVQSLNGSQGPLALSWSINHYDGSGNNRGLGLDTGGVSVTLGSDATGDIYYRNSSGYLTRLAAGTIGYVLTMGASVPAWAAAPSGTISGLTTNRVPYAASATTLANDSNLSWDNTNKALTIGSARFFTPGTSNFFMGSGAGNTSIGIGLENTGIGTNALSSITIGNRHTAIGYNAGATQAAGSNNTFVGNSSGRLNTGSSNTFVGYATGENSTGSNNVALGNAALQTNTSGTFNVAIGASALDASSTLSGNIAVGGNALGALITGTFNVAVGGSASSTGTSMNDSIAIGTNAQFNVSGGSGNIAIGTEAMSGTGTFGSGPNTGSSNVFIGHNSGDFMQSGDRNTAVGNGSMTGANTGSDNTAIGNTALQTVNGGTYNTAIGSGSGTAITSGTDNTLLGARLTGLTTGSSNVMIGQNIAAQSGTASNTLVIQNAIFGTGNSATGTTVSSGNIGIYEVSPTARLHVAASTTAAASLRLPHGTAPTSPNDGDIWTTTAGLYVRVNGVTVGPLS